MHIIWTILIGFVVGLLARILTPGPGPRGFVLTTLLGIVGSLVATYVGQFMGWYQAGQTAGFIGALIGAVVLVLVYHAVARRRA